MTNSTINILVFVLFSSFVLSAISLPLLRKKLPQRHGAKRRFREAFLAGAMIGILTLSSFGFSIMTKVDFFSEIDPFTDMRRIALSSILGSFIAFWVGFASGRLVFGNIDGSIGAATVAGFLGVFWANIIATSLFVSDMGESMTSLGAAVVMTIYIIAVGGISGGVIGVLLHVVGGTALIGIAGVIAFVFVSNYWLLKVRIVLGDLSGILVHEPDAVLISAGYNMRFVAVVVVALYGLVCGLSVGLCFKMWRDDRSTTQTQ